MKVVIQRSKNAQVSVDGEIVGHIDEGLVVFLGVTHDDTIEDADYLAHKIMNLRIFEDDHRKMNLSLKDVQGSLLSISQFTLYGDTSKGRRPHFIDAAKPEHAKKLYDHFNASLRSKGVHVETGVFGAVMDVTLTNAGPVTFILESPKKS